MSFAYSVGGKALTIGGKLATTEATPRPLASAHEFETYVNGIADSGNVNDLIIAAGETHVVLEGIPQTWRHIEIQAGGTLDVREGANLTYTTIIALTNSHIKVKASSTKTTTLTHVYADADLVRDPRLFSNGIILLTDFFEFSAPERVHHRPISNATLPVGSASFTLNPSIFFPTDPNDDWRVGDKLLMLTTDLKIKAIRGSGLRSFGHLTELTTISGITGDNVSIADPLQFERAEYRDAAALAKARTFGPPSGTHALWLGKPHCAMLTRYLRIVGQEPVSTPHRRPYIFIGSGAGVFTGVEVVKHGRTDIRTSSFDAILTAPASITDNVRARDAIELWKADGVTLRNVSVWGGSDGEQSRYEIDGSVANATWGEGSPCYGIAVYDCTDHRLEDCIVFNTFGAAFCAVTEENRGTWTRCVASDCWSHVPDGPADFWKTSARYAGSREVGHDGTGFNIGRSISIIRCIGYACEGAAVTSLYRGLTAAYNVQPTAYGVRVPHKDSGWYYQPSSGAPHLLVKGLMSIGCQRAIIISRADNAMIHGYQSIISDGVAINNNWSGWAAEYTGQYSWINNIDLGPLDYPTRPATLTPALGQGFSLGTNMVAQFIVGGFVANREHAAQTNRVLTVGVNPAGDKIHTHVVNLARQSISLTELDGFLASETTYAAENSLNEDELGKLTIWFDEQGDHTGFGGFKIEGEIETALGKWRWPIGPEDTDPDYTSAHQTLRYVAGHNVAFIDGYYTDTETSQPMVVYPAQYSNPLKGEQREAPHPKRLILLPHQYGSTTYSSLLGLTAIDLGNTTYSAHEANLAAEPGVVWRP